jgi:hypothetical protein
MRDHVRLRGTTGLSRDIPKPIKREPNRAGGGVKRQAIKIKNTLTLKERLANSGLTLAGNPGYEFLFRL